LNEFVKIVKQVAGGTEDAPTPAEEGGSGRDTSKSGTQISTSVG